MLSKVAPRQQKGPLSRTVHDPLRGTPRSGDVPEQLVRHGRSFQADQLSTCEDNTMNWIWGKMTGCRRFKIVFYKHLIFNSDFCEKLPAAVSAWSHERRKPALPFSLPPTCSICLCGDSNVKYKLTQLAKEDPIGATGGQLLGGAVVTSHWREKSGDQAVLAHRACQHLGACGSNCCEWMSVFKIVAKHMILTIKLSLLSTSWHKAQKGKMTGIKRLLPRIVLADPVDKHSCKMSFFYTLTKSWGFTKGKPKFPNVVSALIC